tara:strand:+ start:636 stop:749 length:114 start_codon:yes stop_codon:yes gene_type:complete
MKPKPKPKPKPKAEQIPKGTYNSKAYQEYLLAKNKPK